MRKFFTTIPVCPNCFEVDCNINLKQMDFNEHMFKCSNCGCIFRDNNLLDFNELKISFPFFTEVKLNAIESSYVDWVLNDNGKCLITWPWKTVKFIPILISQYLIKYPDSKILVFCNIEQFEMNKYDDSSLPVIMNSLFSLDAEEYRITDKLDLEDIFVKYDNNNLPHINDNINNSFYKCYNDKFNMIPCFNDNFSFINSIEDINIKKEQSKIFFINETILSIELMEFIENLYPDLIISMDIDSLYGNKFKKGNNIYDLFKLDCTQLYFSTDLSKRNEYKIGQDRYFLKNWDIIPHTWDYRLILEKIGEDFKNEPSFCSSFLEDKQDYKINLKINLIKCEELGKIESTFETFHDLFPYDKMVIDTLKDLMKTPLYITGKYGDKRVLNRNIGFEYLFNLAYNIDMEKWKELINIFEEVYNFGGNSKNPVANSLIDLIKSKDLEDEQLAVIVHKWDIHGTKLILEDKIGENNILVTSWSDLNNDIKEKDIEYGISTLFPPLTYNVSFSLLKEVDIICSPNNFETFESYKLNRFTENGFRPLYLLNENESAPKLLKEYLNDIEIPSDFYDKLNKVHDFNFEYKNLKLKHFNFPTLKRNQNVVLISNEYQQHMFLKFFKVIYIKNDEGNLEDFEINYDNYIKLQNKKILINKGGYFPIENLFFKFVIENGKFIELTDGTFKWHGFKELIENMFEWVGILNEIMNAESTKSEIAEKLSGLELSARREKYIMDKWLEEPEILETELESIKIFNAERPKTEEDISKIYDWVTREHPKFALSKLAAKKCYAASRLLKKVRSDFINMNISRRNDELDNLNLEFKKLLQEEEKIFSEFNIESVEKVKITKDAHSFELIDDPDVYMKK